MNIYPVFKPKGVSSTDVLMRYAKEHGLKDVMHAGALDPLADGVLLVVDDVDNAQQIEMITNMSKTYTFSGVFGFTTDTWGMLGIVQAVGNLPLMQKQYSQSEFTKRIESVIDNYRGIIEQEVPVFSNMRYKNKRMYQWAREGKAYLVPKLVREREIYSLTLDSIDFIRITNLKELVLEDITLVRGDYRQDQILKEWNNLLRLLEGKFGTSLLFPRVTITATCEKGTYIRSIIHSLGQSFGIGAMTTAIHRIKVGEFSLDAAERLGG